MFVEKERQEFIEASELVAAIHLLAARLRRNPLACVAAEKISQTGDELAAELHAIHDKRDGK